MSDVTCLDLRMIAAPYRREVVLQDARFDSGMRLFRLRIREGHRFTLLDLDVETARAIADEMLAWCARIEAEDANGSPESPAAAPDADGSST